MDAWFPALLATALAVIGVCGIVVPVLPGSITVAAGLLVWAIWGSSPWGWLALIVGGALVAAGATSSALLTKRTLDARQIPKWPMVVALIAGIVGTFIVPVVGLLVGFVLGLLVCEWVRVGDLTGAVRTSLAALRAIGLGMLIELACALGASTLLAISILTA